VGSVKPNPIPDAASRLWAAVERAHTDLTANRRQLGQLFYALRNLYSDRNSGDSRLTPGHGTFQEECKKRGYQPRRVREWVNDHEVTLGLRRPAESTAAKRKARRPNSSADYERGYQAAMNDFPSASGHAADPVSHFVGLLPFEALQAAYRAAAKLFHPDLGGDSEEMKRLNSAWVQVEEYFKFVDDAACATTKH
jgi:hypothetical protein